MSTKTPPTGSKELVPTPPPDEPIDGTFLAEAAEPPSSSDWDTFKRLVSYLTRHRGKTAVVVFAAIVFSMASAAIPALFGLGINEYIEKNDLNGLWGVVGAMAAASAVAFVGLFVMTWLLADLAQQAMYDLRKELFEHIQTLSLRFYDRQPIGELMSRVVNDIEMINQFLANGISSILQATFMILALTAAMFAISWQLALAVLVVIPAVALVTLWAGRAAGAAYTELAQNLGELNGYMEETITGQKTVQAYRFQTTAQRRFERLSDAARKGDERANYLGLLTEPATIGIGNVGLALVGLVGGWLAFKNIVMVGTVAAFVGFARQLTFPLSDISRVYNMVLQAVTGSRRVFEILDEEPGIQDEPDAPALGTVAGKVDFDGVDFSYVPGKQVLFDNTFTVEPGQMIGLCGPTGAGKSTIINLITRFYDIQSGDIEVDDQSIYDVQKDTLRGRTGVVPQFPVIFSETVMYNIRYGRLAATDKECVAAAKVANAHTFIERLPGGYDFVLEEGGSNLSQGQRQLITIARAALSDPDVLILDEATSSVDTRTEKLLQEALLTLMKGRTSFVIAHRLSTIRDAHAIIALDGGRVEEMGPHDELIQKRGFYFDLYLKQFKRELLEEQLAAEDEEAQP